MGKQKTPNTELKTDWEERFLKIQGIVKKKDKEKSVLVQTHMKSIYVLLCKGEPSVAAAIIKLKSLQKLGELDSYLRETDYAIFQWGLIKHDLRLVTRLVDLVSSGRAFRMVANDNYVAIKWLINSILQPDVEIVQNFISIKCEILKKIISIKPHDIYYNVIEKIIREHKAENPEIIFPKEFEEIVTNLEREYGATFISSDMGFFPSPVEQSKKKAIKFTEGVRPEFT